MLPDTPAARQLQAFLSAFNSDDPKLIVEYVRSNISPQWQPPPTAEEAARMQFMSGGFEVRKVETSSETSLLTWVRDRGSEALLTLEIQVEPESPHRATRIAIRPGDNPPGDPIPRLSEGEAVKAWEKRLESAAAQDRFSGAVVLAKDDQLLFQRAYGLADRERKVANTLDTRFRLGSMNKMFTAVATLQLVQAGKVKLDDPLGRYIPNYPNPDVASKVTIHHLPTHTGGTGDIFGPEFEKHRLTLRTHDDYLKLNGKRDVLFSPGERFAYSNYGYVLLGVVIERVSGQSYYDYLQEHVYKPAGMSRTGSEPEECSIEGRAAGYMRRHPEREWVSAAHTFPYRGTAAGGGYSTVGDLLRFFRALRRHKLLDAHHTDLLLTGKIDVGGQSKIRVWLPCDRSGTGWADLDGP